MTKPEDNKLHSSLDIVDYLESNSNKTTESPLIAVNVTRLKGINLDIATNQGILLIGTKGKTEAKAVTRNLLIHTTLTIYGKVYAFAVENEDAELEKNMDVEQYHLTELRENALSIKVQSLLDQLHKMTAEQLASCGITAENVTEFENMLSIYNKSKSDSSQSAADKTTARETLTEKLAKMEKALTVLDKLMIEFKNKDPQFYQSYTALREVKDRGIRHNAATDETAAAQANTETTVK
ncbi:MAG: hypothetical protein M1480_11120 [Bacteroidetes bacterium]|nr:hypothetical protein [Bacteroidota bacterium]